MNRICAAVVLALLTAFLGGCGSPGGSTIYAGAPGSRYGTNYTVRDNARYTLYHVTQWNDKGQPTSAQQIASYDLRSGERLGFDWVIDHSHMYDPTAHLNLQAYAAGHRLELGGMTSVDDRYFWADASGWDSYWGGETGRNIGRAITFQ